uniref:Uncharacterized protein n=1 Tax=Siphoviridae sp. ctLnP14 TaxID=2827851 RepID=A0A8S5S8D7_9CAUD|nr:MAG TPA: hypothetical protein [Caudoviricetes sp.]DAF47075.1 MAG TPA: hypothetical protein [Siphoviridae sp. ctLnP14]
MYIMRLRNSLLAYWITKSRRNPQCGLLLDWRD